MAEHELGIFNNTHVPKATRERTTGMLWRLPEGSSFIDSIPPTHSRWQPFPKRIIVAGGDGSMREICQWMHDRGEVRPVGLLPGGSQNVLYHVLQELGLKSDIKTFLEKTSDDYPEDQKLRPGMINDLVFVNHAGLGNFEQHLGRFNARLRSLPNGYRPLVSAVLSVAAAILYPDGNRELLNLYTITPRIGQVLAFPDQELLSNALTHAWIDGLCIKQLQSYCCRDETRGYSIWLDGDTIPYELQGAVIKRAPLGIPMVAIF